MMYNIDEIKVFFSNGLTMLETLNDKLNVDISDSCYFEDESVSVQIKNDKFILDIGTSITGLYDYYFRIFDTDIEILEDFKQITDLATDPVITHINKLYPLS